MRPLLLAGVSAIAFASYGANAEAADLMDMPTIHDWSGLYLGGHIGGTFADVEDEYDFNTVRSASFSFDADGFVGGVQGGYNIQSGSLVLGIEADISFGSIEGTGLCNGSTTPACGTGTGTNPSADIDWVSTVRGRVGVAMDQILLFATAGVGFADASVVDPAQRGSDSHTHTGFVAGGGVEWMMSPNISLRADYLYGNYETISYALVSTPDAIGFETHTIRGGVNWHF